MTSIGVSWRPLPAIAGAITHRTESPTWGSPERCSPASSSTTQTRIGAQTTVGIPAPYVYRTRPSAPGAGVCFSAIHPFATVRADCAVDGRGTSFDTRKSEGTSEAEALPVDAGAFGTPFAGSTASAVGSGPII